MMKSVLISAATIAIASAMVDLEIGSNFIDYGDAIYGFQPPYAYNHIAAKPYTHSLPTVMVPPAAPVVTVDTRVSTRGLLSTALSCIYDLAISGLAFLIKHGSALLLGSAVAIGICKLTPICNGFASVPTFVEIEREIRSIVTPERIARATEFVQNAINKYNSLQEN